MATISTSPTQSPPAPPIVGSYVAPFFKAEPAASEGAMDHWGQIFRVLAWIGVAGFVTWFLIGLSALAAVRDPYSLDSQKELARLQANSALLWAAVSVLTSLLSFFFSALLKGAADVVRLTKKMARTDG